MCVRAELILQPLRVCMRVYWCACERVLFLYIIMGVHVHVGVCLGIVTRRLMILMLNLYVKHIEWLVTQ